MSMFENPSAGKFGPPPENAQREYERARAANPSSTTKDILLIALALVGLGLQFTPRTRGWFGAMVVLLSVIVFVAQHHVQRRVRDERGRPQPYSAPTHLTR